MNDQVPIYVRTYVRTYKMYVNKSKKDSLSLKDDQSAYVSIVLAGPSTYYTVRYSNYNIFFFILLNLCQYISYEIM